MASAAAQPNGHATPDSGSASQASKIQPSDVGWQFVPQYYNFVNKQPHRLHCFYTKRSTFIHGEEGEESPVALGQQAIFDRINAIGYQDCKVFIHSIDSQSSSNGGIVILVIGEMSNAGQPWRKFTQTFFLAEQPNGYFVLNDIFRYLKEDSDEDDEPTADTHLETPAATSIPSETIAAPAAPAPIPITKETEAPIPAPAPEPELPQAPAHPDPEKVPTEAIVASVPDKDQSPSEPSAAVEEPVTTAPPPPMDETTPTPANRSIPATTPAPSAPSASAPSSSTPAPATNGATSTPAAPVSAAPPAPAKPAAPKTWASMAAAGGPAKSWAGMANQAASTSTPTAAPAAPAPVPTPTAPKKEETPAPVPSTSNGPQSLEGKHPFYINAARVNTAHCFVKLPSWSTENQGGGDATDETAVRQAAARFGEVKSIEVLKTKACAFVEFVKVDSARRAIIASLSPSQGGEGGAKVQGGVLNFEVRKEKDERRPKAGPGGPGMGRGGGPADRGGRAGGGRPREDGPGGMPHQRDGSGGSERGGAAGRGGRGRGRGGPPPGGDRTPQQQKS